MKTPLLLPELKTTFGQSFNIIILDPTLQTINAHFIHSSRYTKNVSQNCPYRHSCNCSLLVTAYSYTALSFWL